MRFFANTGLRNKKIEFISIDTEGNELDILKDFNFKQWDVSIFLIEANDVEHAQPIIQLMQRNGFVLSRVLSKNYFFAKDRESITFFKVQEDFMPDCCRCSPPRKTGYKGK